MQRTWAAVLLVAAAAAGCGMAQRLTDDATPACYAAQGVILGANYFAAISASDAGVCCLACFEIEGCSAWTLDRVASTCYLKNNTQNMGPAANHTSGYFPSGGPPPNAPLPPTPVPIARACQGSYAYLPFCDSSQNIDARIDSLLEIILQNASIVPLLLTARASPWNAVPGVIPEYDWGMNAVHGVQSMCAYKNLTFAPVSAHAGAELDVSANVSVRVYNCPTSFSSPNALGAAWNMSLWQSMAGIIGWEARSIWLQGVGENNGHNIPHIGLDAWSPNINLLRDPRWGRAQEVTSEDPLIQGSFGKAYSIGIQEGVDPNHLQVAVTLKHWACYSLEDYGNITRYNFNAIVSPYMFATTYFPHFEMAVTEGDARGIMCAYNAVNGIPSCADPFLAGMLRDEWGFNGYQTSDSGAIYDVYAEHMYVQTPQEAAAVCINDTGGRTDINSGSVYSGYLLDALAMNLTDWGSVTRALRNHFLIRFWLGLFDDFSSPYWNVPADVVNTPQTQALNLEWTRQSMVLLKNTGNVLPLKPGKRIAVIGPHGDAQGDLLGNYLGEICPFGQDDCIVSPLQAITTANVGGTTLYAEGCDVLCTNTSGFQQAVAVAHQSDVVVILAGLNQQCEGEMHDRVSIDLPGFQHQLIANITALGKPTALVLINGGMVAIDVESQTVPAILEAFYPGFQGGQAISDVLFGVYNPGGKLPVTLYLNDSINYWNYTDMDISDAPGRTYRFYTGQPTFPFGHGISYTNFSITWSPQPPSPPPGLQLFTSGSRVVAHNPAEVTLQTVRGDDVSRARKLALAVQRKELREHMAAHNGAQPAMHGLESGNVASGVGILDEVLYTVTVQNIGPVLGDEVVQAYFEPVNVSATIPKDPLKVPLATQLFAFQRVTLAPGASTQVTFALDAAKLSVACPETGAILSAPGTFRIKITNGVHEIVTALVHMQGETQIVDDAIPRQLKKHGRL